MLWLNRFDGMDIRCVRLVPYEIDSKVLLDIQQTPPWSRVASIRTLIKQ